MLNPFQRFPPLPVEFELEILAFEIPAFQLELHLPASCLVAGCQLAMLVPPSLHLSQVQVKALQNWLGALEAGQLGAAGVAALPARFALLLPGTRNAGSRSAFPMSRNNIEKTSNNDHEVCLAPLMFANCS